MCFHVNWSIIMYFHVNWSSGVSKKCTSMWLYCSQHGCTAPQGSQHGLLGLFLPQGFLWQAGDLHPVSFASLLLAIGSPVIFTMKQNNMKIYIHVYIFILFCFIVTIEAHGSQLRIPNSRTGLPTPTRTRWGNFLRFDMGKFHLKDSRYDYRYNSIK